MECVTRTIEIPSSPFTMGGVIAEISSSLFRQFVMAVVDYSGNTRIYSGTPSEFTEQAERAVRHAMRQVACHESGWKEVRRLIELAGTLDIHHSNPYTCIWESPILEIPYTLLGRDDGNLYLVTKDTTSLYRTKPQIGHVVIIPCEKDRLILYGEMECCYQIRGFSHQGPGWSFHARVGFDSARKKWLLASIPHVILNDTPVTTYEDLDALSPAIQELSEQARTYLRELAICPPGDPHSDVL